MSRAVASFLDASKKHSVSAQVYGERKREVGLIVHGLYRARTKKNRNLARFLSKELKRLQSVIVTLTSV